VARQFLADAAAGYIGCCDAIRDLDFTRDCRASRADARDRGGKDARHAGAMSKAIADGIPAHGSR
jgi:hypothetical protein